MLEFKNFWELLKTGNVEYEKRTFKNTSVFVLKMFFLLIVFKLFAISLIYLLRYFNLTDLFDNIPLLIMDNDFSPKRLFFATIFVPIIEELAFRIGLRYSKWNFIIMVIGLAFGLFKILIGLEFLYSVIVSLSAGLILYFSLNSNVSKSIENFWLKNQKIIFYTLLLLFGFLHLFNHEITIELLLLSPVIFLPRLLGGLVYSYVRLSSGIFMAIGFHAFNNLIPTIVTLIVN